MAKPKPSKTIIERCKQLPGQFQQVCIDAAMTRYDEHYHPKNDDHKKHVITDAILGIIVLLLSLLTVYLVFFYQNALIQQGVQLTLSPVSSSITSGQPFEYELVIQNDSDQAIRDGYITIPQSSNFSVIQSEPYIYNQGRVLLDTIPAGKSRAITFTGVAIGEVDSSLLVSSVLHIDKGTIGTSEVFVSESISIMDSALHVEFELPKTIIANQPFDFAIVYENTSSAINFETVRVIGEWPPGFEIISSDPELQDDADYWQFDRIGSLQSGEISGRARLITSDLDEAEFGLLAYTSPYGLPILQQRKEQVSPVSYPNINVNFLSQSSTIDLGDRIEYEVIVENNERVPLNDVQVVLKPNTNLFEIDSLNDQGEVVIALTDTLESQTTKSNRFTLKTKSQVNPQLAFGSGSVAALLSANLEYRMQDEYMVEPQTIVYPLDSVVTNINTNLSARGFARYFSAEGDQLGRGPLPPRVGETTKYWVFIHLDNDLHTVSNINVSGRLPQGVDWTNRKSVTDGAGVNFNEVTRFFQWQAPSIPGFQDDFTQQQHGIAFELAITPSAEQVGSTVSLVESIEVRGTDTVTGQTITRTIPIITSHLLQDAYESGDGKVTL